MKTIASRVVSCLVLLAAAASADTAVTWTNFIRQVQTPSGIQWDVSVATTGTQASGLGVETGGARYELWTVKSSPLTSYLLDTKFVGAYIPSSSIRIRSEDPYTTIPRTRADRPFYVDVTVAGLSSVLTAPLAAKSVKLLHHTQSYGTGTGLNLNRLLATLAQQSSITANGTTTLTYALTGIAGADRTKVRGEERFSLFSLADLLSPEAQLASQYIQIWPVATGTISGITEGQVIKSKAPSLSIALEDLYPSSSTYAQVYKGNAVLGTVGTLVPGLGVVKNDTVPMDESLSLSNWDAVCTDDGTWTLELLTQTPFGIDRLAKVTFVLNRTIRVNGTVTNVE